MSLSSPATTAAGLTVGATATATPFWFEWIPPAYQALTMVLGLVVLILTIAKIWTELQIAKRKRRDLEAGER